MNAKKLLGPSSFAFLALVAMLAYSEPPKAVLNVRQAGGMDLDLVASKMRGEVGTTVEVTVYREGETDYLHFTVKRDTVEVPTVEYRMLEGGIGYIMVAEFDDVTAQQFNDAVKDLSRKNMSAREILKKLQN